MRTRASGESTTSTGCWTEGRMPVFLPLTVIRRRSGELLVVPRESAAN